jgi:GSH-dependent disulfide-bond oxidoreductase
MTDPTQQNQPAGYLPPNVWVPKTNYGGQFSGINRPESGARFNQPLPVGQHPIQLYSQGTPNGQKITILLEELLAAGYSGAESQKSLARVFRVKGRRGSKPSTG